MRFDARKPRFESIERAASYPAGLDKLGKDPRMSLLNLGNFGDSVNHLAERAFRGDLSRFERD